MNKYISASTEMYWVLQRATSNISEHVWRNEWDAAGAGQGWLFLPVGKCSKNIWKKGSVCKEVSFHPLICFSFRIEGNSKLFNIFSTHIFVFNTQRIYFHLVFLWHTFGKQIHAMQIYLIGSPLASFLPIK